MPTLLEIERAVARSLFAGDPGEAARQIVADGLPAEARLQIYRNTFFDKTAAALRLTYPAVLRLVGGEFFAGATRLFIRAKPPRRADLGAYGEDFADFLGHLPEAAGLPYLAGVARLECAVAQALQAPDREPLDPYRLAAIEPALHESIAFVPHPSVRLVAANHPVDAIRGAVLAGDDAALAAIDLADGPVWLLVERRADGIEVDRLNGTEWDFTAALFAGEALCDAIAAAPDVDAGCTLGGHLAAGRFIDFRFHETGCGAGR